VCELGQTGKSRPVTKKHELEEEKLRDAQTTRFVAARVIYGRLGIDPGANAGIADRSSCANGIDSQADRFLTAIRESLEAYAPLRCPVDASLRTRLQREGLFIVSVQRQDFGLDTVERATDATPWRAAPTEYLPEYLSHSNPAAQSFR